MSNSNYLMDIPSEKVHAMQKYAKELRKKFPTMKRDRLARKVAEYFKVKIVKENETNSIANFSQAKM